MVCRKLLHFLLLVSFSPSHSRGKSFFFVQNRPKATAEPPGRAEAYLKCSRIEDTLRFSGLLRLARRLPRYALGQFSKQVGRERMAEPPGRAEAYLGLDTSLGHRYPSAMEPNPAFRLGPVTLGYPRISVIALLECRSRGRSCGSSRRPGPRDRSLGSGTPVRRHRIPGFPVPGLGPDPRPPLGPPGGRP